MSTISNQQLELHPSFPSGEWEGFYLYFGEKYKMECHFEFKNELVTGWGSDVVGNFYWDGSYDTEKETCTITKQYIGKHQVFYKGNVDENGIWGTWKIVFLSDGFHLWPKNLEIANHNKEKATNRLGKPFRVIINSFI